MIRYTVDHRAGNHGREATLVDEHGRRVLGLSGDWAVTDESGRTSLFLSPDLGGIARSAVVSGIVGGVLDLQQDSLSRLRNAGEGVQTVKRATPPIRGVPFRWTPVATVFRDPRQPGMPDVYRVAPLEPALPPVAFAQQADAAALAGYANGFADARFGVYDLLRADGRPVLRHWASIGPDLRLTTSVFDVEDETYPLPEAVILCLARVLSWRS